MNVLITGGAGFIGSNYCNYALNKYPGNVYYCIDKMTYAASKINIEKFLDLPNFHFIKEDISNMYFLNQFFSTIKIDLIINFAAETHVDKSISNPQEFMITNFYGTYALLEMCRKYGIKRFHQVSTDEVYGDLSIDAKSFSEDAPLRPSNPYSASKASADLLVLSYVRTYGIFCTISRSSNNFGPKQFYEKLVPYVIQKAYFNEQIKVYGNGENIRDWIYVCDHIEAIDLILEKGKSGEVYNISGSNEMSNLDIIKKILSILNKSEKLISFIEDRKGHDFRYSLDNKKLFNLGFNYKNDFNKNLESTVEWYLIELKINNN